MDRDALVVTEELYNFFKENYGVNDQDTFTDVYRVRNKSIPKLANQFSGLSLYTAYSFASAELVRFVIQVPLELKKEEDGKEHEFPDRIWVFDEENKCNNLGGTGAPPPPPMPPIGGISVAPPSLPSNAI